MPAHRGPQFWEFSSLTPTGRKCSCNLLRKALRELIILQGTGVWFSFWEPTDPSGQSLRECAGWPDSQAWAVLDLKSKSEKTFQMEGLEPGIKFLLVLVWGMRSQWSTMKSQGALHPQATQEPFTVVLIQTRTGQRLPETVPSVHMQAGLFCHLNRERPIPFHSHRHSAAAGSVCLPQMAVCPFLSNARS